MYELLATTENLKTYLGISELPDEASRLLQRASEIVWQACFNNLNVDNEVHAESSKLATCAQVEYWLELGEMISMIGGIRSMAIGTFEIEFAIPENVLGAMQSGQLSNRTRNFLMHAGLLYRGVKRHADTEYITTG